MIIYNVTVNIEDSIEQGWVQWMKDTHIPDVMKTGMFLSSKMTHVLVEEQMGGKTYSIQYTCENKETLDEYQQKYAPALQTDHNDKYQGKFVAFRTLLEVIHEM
jgi:hypothetical protein